MTKNPIIVALDVENVAEARGLIKKLGSHVNFFKVGLELYASAGVELVRELVAEGRDVFLDLKFYDIPETVKRATVQVAGLGVRFLTVHAVASVMRAAAKGRGDSDLRILAVTVLTSFGQEDLDDLGYQGEISALVERRALKALECGIGGIVASPLEAAAVRAAVGPDTVIVTPGVRSTGSAKGDQKRVASPAEAIRAGADYLVIGRQITRAADPAAATQRVLDEIAW